jgi:hypothetical protein
MAEVQHKGWWKTWWVVVVIVVPIVTTVIAELIVWGITRHYDRLTPVPSISASAPSPSVPVVKTPKPTPPPPSVKIEQHGKGNGAVGGNITTAPCSSVQVGGNNNQANVNCGPPPLKITWSVIDKPSQDSKHPFYREVSVTPNVEWHPVALEVKCSGDIRVISPYGMLYLPDGYVSPRDSKMGYVTAEGPSVAAGGAFTFGVFADEPFTVDSVVLSKVPRRRNSAEGPQ